MRIDQKCLGLVGRVEEDFAIFKSWKEAEKETSPNVGAKTSTADKRDREPTPSKTQRALKKLCPPNPGQNKLSTEMPTQHSLKVVSCMLLRNRTEDTAKCICSIWDFSTVI